GPDHVIDVVNPIYEQFFCDTSCVGQPLSTALPQLRREHGFCELLDHVYKTGAAISGRQWTMKSRDGKDPRIFSFSYQPMYGQDRQIEGVTVFAFDITDQVKAAEKLEQLTSSLRKAHDDIRGQDDFFAAVAHELRTPITSVLGWTRLLKGGDLDAATSGAALTSIEYSSTVLANLIEDLLDDVRATAGKLRLDMQPLDLSAPLEAAISALAPAVGAKAIQLTTRLDTACPIKGDFNRLQQAIWNILANAVKFTPEAGTIAVELTCADSEAVLEISDNGIGVDAALLPHIFEPYRQAEEKKIERRGGLGLGLGIARRLIEVHGGQLTAASEGAEQGTTFTIRVPLQQAAVGR
ncbi:MAG TPA: ATP-binding protein, partial [Thermoanaerobaculia bacterium]